MNKVIFISISLFFVCFRLHSQSVDFDGGIEYSAAAKHNENPVPFDPPGWANDTIISQNDAKESIHPDVQIDSNKNIHVVWKDNGSSTNGIYYRKYDGSNWGTIIDLSNPGINSNSPTIAVDMENNVHVVFLRWSGVPYAHYNVGYKRYDDSTGTWGQEWVITTDDSLGLSARPKVVTDSNKNVYAFWLDERDTPLTIWYKVNDGSGWSPDIRVTDTTASPNGYFGVTVSPDDYVHICWQDYRSGTAEIYHKFFDGLSWSVEEAITNNGFTSAYPRIAPDSSNNIYLFYGGSAHLHYLMWDRTAQTWGNGQNFSTAFALPHADIAVDLLTGDRHVLFAEYIGYSVIYYKKYDASIGTWEMDVQLTFTTDGSYEPQVATDVDNLVYVTWYDYRSGTGQEEIYFKKTVPTGIKEDYSDFVSNSLTKISAYPNPFVKKVEIRMQIPEIKKMENRNCPIAQFPISLCIYDVSGRLVRNLVTGDLRSATLMWDGKDKDGRTARVGIYFLQVENMNSTEIISTKLIKME